MAQSPDPAPPLPGAPPVMTGNLMAVGSMVVWAAGFPAAERLLATWNPLALVSARFLVAILILVPAWLALDGVQALRTARWGHGTLVGSLAFGAGAYLLILAQWLTDPVTVAIIAAASPIAATLVEMVYERRRLRPAFIVGLLASLVGGVVATGGGGSPHFGAGAALAVVSSVLFAWGSYLTVRDFPDLSVIGRTTITLSGGLLATGTTYLAAYALGIVPAPAHPFDPTGLGLLVIYGVGGMALSQFL
ncbi:MAG: EamA family transporter [Limimaricola sp.]|uniref:EamA family transporter n=1 Tax=Limimaricola sp. TaxID=2211665 RepID=UPI001D5E993B|nr:EamA family transporter [Limimaricola sp.]MBI1417631.1 EamA family transporter [Limimaricola sp.]